MEAASKSGMTKPKKQLIVNFATPMSEDGSVPREIDGFLTALRGEPMLKRHFPLIEVIGPQGQLVQAGRASLRILQHRLLAQGRGDQDASSTLERLKDAREGVENRL